jgi:hypothetical protein
MGKELGFSWSILSFVTSKSCNSLNLKLAGSLPMPVSLHDPQLCSQSLSGKEISGLQGMYCIVWPSSVKILTYSLVDMVLTFKEFLGPPFSWCKRMFVDSKEGIQG